MAPRRLASTRLALLRSFPLRFAPTKSHLGQFLVSINCLKCEGLAAITLRVAPKAIAQGTLPEAIAGVAKQKVTYSNIVARVMSFMKFLIFNSSDALEN